MREATGGRLHITVHSANEGLTRAHLGIIQQFIDGEIEFYLSMGGVLSTLVPAMAVHDVPFVIANSAQALGAFDGPLGDFLREEIEDHGIVTLPFGLLENGFRHITTAHRPLNAVENLAAGSAWSRPRVRPSDTYRREP